MPVAVLIPLVNTILQIILQAQISFNNAPDEYKDNFYKRLDKWENFWDKLADPVYRLIDKEANEQTKPTVIKSTTESN